MTNSELREKFNSFPVLFTTGKGGLSCLQIKTELAEATVYLHGAHITHFQPAGQKPLLFMSTNSLFVPGKPIRGGIPICWPWFGPKADNPAAPMHGVARLLEWTVSSISENPDGEIDICLKLYPSELSNEYWGREFLLEYRIRIGRQLSLCLSTTNSGKTPFTINEALHSYFTVGDVRGISVTGLEKRSYMDKTLNMQRFIQGDEPLCVTGETDRHFVNTPDTCIINDPSLGRRIFIEKGGSKSTVVWNPWIAKSKAMPDFGDDEWVGMVCVETANAADNAVIIPPGSTHELKAMLKITPL